MISFSTKFLPRRLRVGVHLPDSNEVLDLGAAFGRNSLTMKKLLRMGDKGLKAARAAAAAKLPQFRYSMDDVNLKAPIYDPEKVLCIGMNYVDHCTEQDYPIPTEPVVFSKFASSICAPGDPIILENTDELDFEVELVIVVGKKCRNVTKDKAMQYVAGYTVAHDVSARDWQLKRNGGQWLLGKTMDSFAPIGPAIVTTDELKDPHALGIRCILNGKTVQDSNTNQLIFRTEDVIEWVSRFVTLQPGDLILTGTPPGVGCFRKPPMFLKNGDVVTCEIDGIGSITNTVRERSAKL